MSSKALDFIGDHSKSAACITGACCLNRRVEGKQVGLCCDIVNEANDLADTLRLAGTATTGARTLAGYGMCTLRKVATTTWFAAGAGLT